MTYVDMRCVDSSISTMIDAIYVEYYVITTRYSKLSLGTVFDPTSKTRLGDTTTTTRDARVFLNAFISTMATASAIIGGRALLLYSPTCTILPTRYLSVAD